MMLSKLGQFEHLKRVKTGGVAGGGHPKKLHTAITWSFFNGFGRNFGLHRSKFIVDYADVKNFASFGV